MYPHKYALLLVLLLISRNIPQSLTVVLHGTTSMFFFYKDEEYIFYRKKKELNLYILLNDIFTRFFQECKIQKWNSILSNLVTNIS